MHPIELRLMFAYIKGTVQRKTEKYIIVLHSDLGYKVFLKESDREKLKVGEEIELHLYHYIKDDTSDLYGFKTLQELEMFELLLSISGIGPKAALGILQLASVDQIKQAVASGDSSILTRVSGVGKKTAERVILELKSKISGLDEISGNNKELQSDMDVIDALVGLGYSQFDAREVLKTIDRNLDVSEKIKKALGILSKH